MKTNYYNFLKTFFLFSAINFKEKKLNFPEKNHDKNLLYVQFLLLFLRFCDVNPFN